MERVGVLRNVHSEGCGGFRQDCDAVGFTFQQDCPRHCLGSVDRKDKSGRGRPVRSLAITDHPVRRAVGLDQGLPLRFSHRFSPPTHILNPFLLCPYTQSSLLCYKISSFRIPFRGVQNLLLLLLRPSSDFCCGRFQLRSPQSCFCSPPAAPAGRPAPFSPPCVTHLTLLSPRLRGKQLAHCGPYFQARCMEYSRCQFNLFHTNDCW